ncbi:MAG TPA: hypothetical protein VG146_20750 [Verrucomicrobiae bacterium]|nr:hypothetical protein [Verrucomicrobiae bacterium]
MENVMPISPTPAAPSAPPILRPPASPRLNPRTSAGYVILALVLCLPLLCAIGIANCFRLSSVNQALRSSVMESVPGHWDKRFAIHAGGLTLAFARFGSSFFNLPPEPKAALGALHGADVGVYKLLDAPQALDYSALFTRADKAMKRRGWERMVGVARGGQFVAVYLPRDMRALQHVACCVVVLNEGDLVIASARGNLEPLLALPWPTARQICQTQKVSVN